jgi:hypothetical protein
MWMVLVAFLLMASMSAPVAAAEPVAQKPAAVPSQDYPLYDLVVQTKYLRSDTSLVLIERLTVTRIEKDEREYLSREFFEEQGVFSGRLPADLLNDFFAQLAVPARLEGLFKFGVSVRFFHDGVPEEPEVSLAPIPVVSPPRPVQEAPMAVGVLRFSRIGYTRREDQALLYVEEERPDGGGGGLLVWLRRQGKTWAIADTDVLWAARSDEAGIESP